MSNNKLGTILTLVSAAAFGAMAIFAKFVYAGGARVPTVLFFRFMVAALFFWLFQYLKKDTKPYQKKITLQLLALGALGYGSMSGLFFLSINRVPASLAGMLLYLYPALVTLATMLLGQEKFTVRKGGALLTASCGLVLVLGTSFQGEGDLLGILAGLGAACAYTVYIVSGSRVVQALEPIKATTYIMTGAAFTYLIYGLLTQSITFAFDFFTWLNLGGIIFISTIVAITTFWWGVKLIGPSGASIISTVEPLITVILAWLAFGEVLTLTQLLGGFLILSGVVILQGTKKKSPEALLQGEK